MGPRSCIPTATHFGAAAAGAGDGEGDDAAEAEAERRAPPHGRASHKAHRRDRVSCCVACVLQNDGIAVSLSAGLGGCK